MLLLCVTESGGDKIHWRGCVQGSINHVATLLRFWLRLEAANRTALAARFGVHKPGEASQSRSKSKKK